ncbi:MAG: polysaccharide biosynthesis protein [Bacillota bacterium]|nr:polysaccharide biosynthesis protein [Bacillota bacterium]
MEAGKQTGRRENSFLKGALILSIAGLVVRFIGAFFRIPLANLLSVEAMSYYSSAYPIFAFFIAVATTGFPTAVARLIAEYKALGKTSTIRVIYDSCLMLMLIICGIGFLVTLLFADSIAVAIGNEGAALSLKVLAPGILFCGLLSVYRGYFQGFQFMNPFAVSMVVEQFIRVLFGLSLAAILVSVGDEWAAAGATMGATIGGFVALVYIFWRYRKLSSKWMLYNPLGDKINVKSRTTVHDDLSIIFVKDKPTDRRTIINRTLRIAVPITISASIIPFISIIDVAMVVNRLTDIGFTPERAKEMFTMMSAYAGTLLNFPMAIISGLQISVVPAVTAVFSLGKPKEVRKLIKSALKVNSLITLPSSVGLAVLSVPIIHLLYPTHNELVGKTGEILTTLAFSVFFLGGFLVSTGIYQAIEKTTVPVQNLLIGVAVKIGLTYILTGIYELNIIGACIASVTCYFVAWLLNMLRLRVYTDVDYDLPNTYVKPLVASVLMGIVCMLVYHGVYLVIPRNSISTLVAIMAGMAVYLFLILVLRVLRKDDYELLPAGSKIKAIEQRLFKNRAAK